MTNVNSKVEALRLLLDELNRGNPILVVGVGDDLPIRTIHNFYRRNPDTAKKYWESIKHYGFGVFEGQTEYGTFGFLGGGAMSEFRGKGWWIAWCPLTVSDPEVLRDLDYRFDEMRNALTALIEGESRGNC